jgi:hypothetical protein
MKRGCGLLLILTLIASSFLILLPVRSAVGVTPTVYIDPPVVFNPSALFDVSMKLDNVVGLAGAEVWLTWDPTILRGVKMIEVMFHEATPIADWDNIWQIDSRIDNIAGVAYYIFTFVDTEKGLAGGYEPISGNHTMAILTFQVIGVGNCTLHFKSIKMADPNVNPIIPDTTDGFVSNSIPPVSLPPSPLEGSQLLLYFNPHRVMDESLVVNDTFSVSVEIQQFVTHHGIISLDVGLEYNPTVLECINATDIMFNEAVPANDSNNLVTWMYLDSGRGVQGYNVAFKNFSEAFQGGYGPIFGNHTVEVLTFRVKSLGATSLHVAGCDAVDDAVSTMVYSAIDGYFSDWKKGNLNHDGVVDMFDALMFAKSFGAYLTVSPSYSNWNEEADLNGDGKIDIFDAIILCSRFYH